jgi:hypothetical protein
MPSEYHIVNQVATDGGPTTATAAAGRLWFDAQPREHL